MNRFAVFSGFLGSGKTTAMMALTRYCSERSGKAAMISNDLGEGVTLADHRFAQLSGCRASQITDECICFCHERLAERLRERYDEGCELVVSDIPGFGVGALEHVYHGLQRDWPGLCELAPFTVFVEPRTVALLRNGQAGDLGFIWDAQLREADQIVLSKCDLLDAAELAEDRAWLAARYPLSPVIAFSALRGDGLEELSESLMHGRASLRHPEIDYDGDGLQEAMGSLSEYYLEYRALVCCRDFDGTEYLADIARIAQAQLRAAGREIPHLKLLAWEPEGDFAKVDLLSAERPVEIARAFERPCTELAVLLNGSAACPAPQLDTLLSEAVSTISRTYQLELSVFKKDCFGMGG